MRRSKEPGAQSLKSFRQFGDYDSFIKRKSGLHIKFLNMRARPAEKVARLKIVYYIDWITSAYSQNLAI